MAFDLVGKAVRRFRLPTVCYDNVPIKVIPAQAGDVNSRFFDVEIYDDRGAIDLHNYESVALNAKLPSGALEMYFGEINITDNCVVIKVPSSIIKEPGKVICDISLRGHDKAEPDEATLLTTQRFYIVVSESQASDEAVEATNEYGLLLQLIEDLTVLENEVNVAETLREKNENKRINQENDRISAENSRVATESARVTAEAERVNSELERLNNETARENNEIERSAAETERKKAEGLRQIGEADRRAEESNRIAAEQNRVAAEQNRVAAETNRINAENERVESETIRQQGYEEMKGIIDNITDGSGTVQQSERAKCDDEGNVIKDTYAKINNVVRNDIRGSQEILSSLDVACELNVKGTINDVVSIGLYNGSSEITEIVQGGIRTVGNDGVSMSAELEDKTQIAVGLTKQNGKTSLYSTELSGEVLQVNNVDLGNSLLPWKDLYLSGKIIGGLISREDDLPSADSDDAADLVATGDDLYWKIKAGGWKSTRGPALKAYAYHTAIVQKGVGEYDVYTFGGYDTVDMGARVDIIQKVSITQNDMSVEILDVKMPVKTATFPIYAGNGIIYLFAVSWDEKNFNDYDEIYKFNINTEEISKMDLDYASYKPLGIVSGKIFMSINGTNDIKILDTNTDEISDFPAKLLYSNSGAYFDPGSPKNTYTYKTKIFIYGGGSFGGDADKIQIIDTENETVELLGTTIPDDGYYASYLVVNKDIPSGEYSNGAIIRVLYNNASTGEYYYAKWYYHNFENNTFEIINLPSYTSLFALVLNYSIGFQHIGIFGYDVNTRTVDMYPARYVKLDSGSYQKLNLGIFVGGTKVNSLVFEMDPQEAINLRYIKPESGIPADDLSADVVESLNLAKSALQKIPDNLLIPGENITIEKNEEGSFVISSTASGSSTWVPTLITEEEYLEKLEAGEIDENTVYYIEGTSDSKLTVEISEQQLADLMGIETNQINILASVATGLSAEEVTKLIALLSGLNSTQIQNLVDAAKIISVTSVDGVQCLTAPGFNEV